MIFKLHLRTPHDPPRIDYLGATLLTGGVGALILLTTWGGIEYAWGSPLIIGLGVAGVVLLAAFVWQERRAQEPIIPLTLFRSRVFNVSSAMGATIGMAMFGAIIFIPLYLQLVYGVERHEVGPAHAAADARPARRPRSSRAARSPAWAATACSRSRAPARSSSACSCSRASASDTAPWLASVYMLVVGVGIGLVMQVLVLVVQNDAPPENIGVATSTATFFRSMGGSFGVAIFGAIFAARLSRPARALPASVVERLGSGVQLSPAEADSLPPAMHAEFLDAFAHALHGVFLWGMAIAIIPFALSWFLKEVPLRTTLAHARPSSSAEEAAGRRARRRRSSSSRSSERP